jgi:hypothetical protein
MGGVFISYRRDDVPGWAHWMRHMLRQRFAAIQLFQDITNIQPGQDFRRTIATYIDQCDALIVVIGPQWRTARLSDPDDPVRCEIEQAIQRQILIMPLTFDNAAVPREEDLPDSLRPLTARHSVRIGGSNPESDVEQVLRTLKTKVSSSLTAVLRHWWAGSTIRSSFVWMRDAIKEALGALAGVFGGVFASIFLSAGVAKQLSATQVMLLAVSTAPTIAALIAVAVALFRRQRLHAEVVVVPCGALLLALAAGLAGMAAFPYDSLGPIVTFAAVLFVGTIAGTSVAGFLRSMGSQAAPRQMD